MILQRCSRTGGAFGLGVASLPLQMELPNRTSTLEYRLRDANNVGVALLDWTVAAEELASGPQTVELTIPATRTWYLIDVRVNTENIASTTTRIGVGEITAVFGQSLAVDFFAAKNNDSDSITLSSLGITPCPYTSVFAAWTTDTLQNVPPAWSTPADGTVYKSTFAAEFLRLMVRASHVNCALIGYGRNGQPISQFIPGRPDNIVFKNIVLSAGGSFSTLIFIQGHGDSQEGTSQTSYHEQLSEIMADLAFTFGTFKSMLCSIPSLTATSEGTPIAVNSIRAAQMQYVAGCDTCSYVAGLDASLDQSRDPVGVHPDQKGDLILARHFYRSAQKLLGLNYSVGDEGPRIVAAWKSPDGYYVDLVVQHTDGTALVGIGAPIHQAEQFKIFPAGSIANPLQFDPVSPIDLTVPTRIRLKLANPIPTNCTVDIWYRLVPDSQEVVRAGIYDDLSNEEEMLHGRQLTFFSGPLTAQPSIKMMMYDTSD
jgi:hypothetical protein